MRYGPGRSGSSEPLGRILIAGENVQSRGTLAKYLAVSGYQTASALDGVLASKRLISERYEACIVDIALRNMAIGDFFAHVRMRGNETPFIIISEDPSPETERQARRYSPAFYFITPLHLPHVRDVLDIIILRRIKDASNTLMRRQARKATL